MGTAQIDPAAHLVEALGERARVAARPVSQGVAHGETGGDRQPEQIDHIGETVDDGSLPEQSGVPPGESTGHDHTASAAAAPTTGWTTTPVRPAISNDPPTMRLAGR